VRAQFNPGTAGTTPIHAERCQLGDSHLDRSAEWSAIDVQTYRQDTRIQQYSVYNSFINTGICYAVDFEVSMSIYRHSMQLVLAGIGTIIKTHHEILFV